MVLLGYGISIEDKQQQTHLPPSECLHWSGVCLFARVTVVAQSGARSPPREHLPRVQNHRRVHLSARHKCHILSTQRETWNGMSLSGTLTNNNRKKGIHLTVNIFC